MIRVNELRIGNHLFSQKELGTVVVKSIERQETEIHILRYQWGDWEGEGILEEDGRFQPIPLTPEVIKACGFKRHHSSDKVMDLYFLGDNPVTHDFLITLKWVKGREWPFYRNAFHEIKSLHQLQNLYYALTGQELEINL